jgi:pimeloyl-ACP methyl ester carboxylesterase
MTRVEARGIELAWESRGEGAEVVLVHETGVTRAAWRGVADAVEALGGRAILYDRRGWGASSAPEGYRRTTVEEQSEDLAELIGAAGSGSAPTLCGAGLGALIALDLLLRRPDLVAGAVLVEPHVPGLVPEATEALSDDREAIAKAVHEGGVDAVLDLYLSGRLGGLGPGAGRLPPEQTAAARARPASLIAELGAAAGWAMPLNRLAEAQRPVVVLAGPDTPPVVRGAAEALAARLPAVESVEVASEGPPHLRAEDAVAMAAAAAESRGG